MEGHCGEKGSREGGESRSAEGDLIRRGKDRLSLQGGLSPSGPSGKEVM